MTSQNKCIEFVYLDLGNMLVSFDPAIACRNFSERFGVAVEDARAAVYDSGLQDHFEQGDVDPSAYTDAIRRHLRRSESEMPTQDVLDSVSDMFAPIDSMEPVLSQLRDTGRGVGLLSNTCHAHWDWIVRQQYGVTNFDFDVRVLSFEIGSMKPQPEIYQEAERASGVPADRILFLDDKQENVDAARGRGWHAVQCLGGAPAIAALRSFGVLRGEA